MASPPIVDVEALLASIAGADPAGESLPFEMRKKLDDWRKEVNLSQFAPNDPRRPEQPQPADWPAIVQLAPEILARTSKDFLVAARLTEALVKHQGFGGLRDGLRLLRRLIEECWDRAYPSIQDGDLEGRAAVFNWLDDELKGARFPYTLRTVALTRVGKEPEYSSQYGWQHWKDAQDAKGPVTSEAFDQAVAATPREYCQTVVEDIAECVPELAELTKLLNGKLGEAAPGLSQVRRALFECQDLAQYILKRKGPAPVAAQEIAAEPAEAVEAAQPGGAPAARRPLTRDDLLARLADASAQLLQMEPHSPIAYLVQRAVKLARLPLPELMRVLVREPSVLSQLDRDLDLGLEKQEAAKAGKSK
jgi:type VI secretion system protein ImpA